METSASKPRTKKVEGGKEQPNNNQPTRKRKIPDRNDQTLPSKKQHKRKKKQVKDSSDSENEQLEVVMPKPNAWLDHGSEQEERTERKHMRTRLNYSFEPYDKSDLSILEDRVKDEVPVAKPLLPPLPPPPPVAPM